MEKKNSLFENLTFTKVLSFFLALILWFFVAGDRQETDIPVYEMRRTFEEIPLVFRNLGEDLVVVEMVDSVTISLQGAQPSFDGLTPADLEAYVDLNGKKEGRHEVRIKATAPPGMSIVRIEPFSTVIVLEDLIALQMPVQAQYQGENKSGMIVDEISFKPQHVFVQGSRNKVELTEQVVFYMDIEKATGIIQEKARLYPVDNMGRVIGGVTVSPEFVNIQASFDFPRKELPVKAALKNNGLEVESIDIEPAEVTVRGPKNLLEEASVIFTEEIDLKRLESGTAEEVLLVFPKGITPDNNDSVLVRIYFTQE